MVFDAQESFGDDELLVELSDAQLSSLLDRLKELLEQNASVTRQFDECQVRRHSNFELVDWPILDFFSVLTASSPRRRDCRSGARSAERH